MNSEERQMITGLFDRMRQTGAGEKDRDAEALINQSVRQIPDSAYMLVQSVLVQEHTLQQAGQRIEELEDRVRALESEAQARPAQSSGGSFLGGLFGGGAKPQPQPMTAPRQSPSFGSVPQTRSPWGQQPAQAPMQSPMQAAAAGGGGGFMKSAMATAAGVAGGMLLADSIRGMMSGSPAHAAGSSQTASGPMGPEAAPAADHSANTYSDDDNDPGTQAAADDGGSWGGGDDLDI